MLRIIAGEFRSRILQSPPDGETTRPYLGRVKEAVFNRLRGWFEDAVVLDLFAGVGSVGLEAISRGAKVAVLVERDKAIFGLLKQNIADLDCADRAIAVQADATMPPCLDHITAPVDVVFIDPPYVMMQEDHGVKRVFDQIERCRRLMGDTGFVVLRSPIPPPENGWTVPGFDGPEVNNYGRAMYVLLYAPSQRDDETAAP